MRLLLLTAGLAAMAAALPQVDLDIVGAISGQSGSYGGEPVEADEVISADTANAIVQIVKETKPADYAGETEEEELAQVKTEVDTVFPFCANYTAEFGYECVPYYQCANGLIITDGAGLIDVRIDGYGNLDPLNSKCPGFLDVCCKDPDFVPPPAPKIIHQPKCGRHNAAGVGARIQGFNEDESQFGEWPHMCAVLHSNDESSNLYKCGGSLIAPGVILTGAHCVNSFVQTPDKLKVRCGEWDTQRTSEPYQHQDRLVSGVKIHPEFNDKNLENDFAVLFLTEDFALNFHIDTVCLPRPNEYFVGDSCFATGWGKDKYGAEGNYQVVLKEIELKVVNSVVCQDKLRDTRLGNKFKLHESFLCAGGEAGKDTCKGDGGSPLVCPSKNDPNVYEQAGLVAWGIGCGEDGVPGVYGSVSKTVCWIDSVVTCQLGAASNSFDSYFGYEDSACGIWLEDALARLSNIESYGGGNPQLADGIAQIKQQYQECSVVWLKTAEEEPEEEKPKTVDDTVDDSVHIGNAYTNDLVGEAPKVDEEVIVDGSEDGTFQNGGSQAAEIKDAGDAAEQYGGVKDGSEAGDEAADIKNGEEAAGQYAEVKEVNVASENCADYTKEFGFECVESFQCNSDGLINTDGAGIFDVRFGEVKPDGLKCPRDTEVCCKDPDFVAPLITKTVYEPKCGRHNSDGVGARIQGFKADESHFGEWPHMCAILQLKPSDNGGTTNEYLCGASLITANTVVTAAHCVDDLKSLPNEIKVRCGEWDTQTTTEEFPHQDRIADLIKVHPEFNNKNLANDFALVFLSEDFVLDSHIDTICLPKSESVVYDGETCTATGWGKDQFGAEGSFQAILKEIQLNVVEKGQCQDSLRNTRLGGKFKLDESFLCAGGVPGEDTCKGDGGSPLACPSRDDPERYELAGLVAWGIGCGQDLTPGVYGSIAKAVCWIDYTITCRKGVGTQDFASVFGNDCRDWQEATQQRLVDGPEEVRQAYQECEVIWVETTAKDVDVNQVPYVRFGGDDNEEEGEENNSAVNF